MTVQIEVLTQGLGVQVIGAGGHNYQAQPVSVDSEPAQHANLAEARPNPSHGWVDLSLTLGESTSLDVGVFDLSGRRVATLSRGVLGPGVHPLRWDGRGADGGVLRGMFFVRARGDGVELARRVVMVR